MHLIDLGKCYFGWPMLCFVSEEPGVINGKVLSPVPVVHNVTEIQTTMRLQEDAIQTVPKSWHTTSPLSLDLKSLMPEILST